MTHRDYNDEVQYLKNEEAMNISLLIEESQNDEADLTEAPEAHTVISYIKDAVPSIGKATRVMINTKDRSDILNVEVIDSIHGGKQTLNEKAISAESLWDIYEAVYDLLGTDEETENKD